MKLPPVATKRSKIWRAPCSVWCRCAALLGPVPARSRAVRSEALRIAMKAD